MEDIEDNILHIFEYEESDGYDSVEENGGGEVREESKEEKEKRKGKGKEKEKKTRKKKGKKKNKGKGRKNDGFKLHKYVKALGEELKENNLYLLYSSIDVLGLHAFQKIVQRVRLIEMDGGMRTCSGDRRKTGGGVLFKILKQQYPKHYRQMMDKYYHLKEQCVTVPQN